MDLFRKEGVGMSETTKGKKSIFFFVMCFMCILCMTACAQKTENESKNETEGKTTYEPANEIIQSLDQYVEYTPSGSHFEFSIADVRNMELSYYDNMGKQLWNQQLPGAFTSWEETENEPQPIFQLYGLEEDRCAVLVQLCKGTSLYEELDTSEIELFTYFYVYDAKGTIVHQTALSPITGRMEAEKLVTGKYGNQIYLAVFTEEADEKCLYTEYICNTDTGEADVKQISIVQIGDTGLKTKEGDPEPVYKAFYWKDKLAVLSNLYGEPDTSKETKYISSEYMLQVYDSDTGKQLWEYHFEADHERKNFEQVDPLEAAFTILTQDYAVLAFPAEEEYTLTVLDASGNEISTRDSLNYAYPIGHKNKDSNRFLFDLSGSYTEYYIADENLTWESPVTALNEYIFSEADFYDEYFVIYECMNIEDMENIKNYHAVAFLYSGEKIWEIPY